jgi:hypothetical protein
MSNISARVEDIGRRIEDHKYVLSRTSNVRTPQEDWNAGTPIFLIVQDIRRLEDSGDPRVIARLGECLGDLNELKDTYFGLKRSYKSAA